MKESEIRRIKLFANIFRFLYNVTILMMEVNFEDASGKFTLQSWKLKAWVISTQEISF